MSEKRKTSPNDRHGIIINLLVLIDKENHILYQEYFPGEEEKSITPMFLFIPLTTTCKHFLYISLFFFFRNLKTALLCFLLFRFKDTLIFG